ncbi:hypothetical protein [Streptomyces sp. NPDC054786]
MLLGTAPPPRYFSANTSYKDTRGGPSNDSDVYAIKALLKKRLP